METRETICICTRLEHTKIYIYIYIQLVTWTYTHLYISIYNICSLSKDISHSSPLLKFFILYNSFTELVSRTIHGWETCLNLGTIPKLDYQRDLNLRTECRGKIAKFKVKI